MNVIALGMAGPTIMRTAPTSRSSATSRRCSRPGDLVPGFLGAGRRLRSLRVRTRIEPQDDHFLVNGQKAGRRSRTSPTSASSSAAATRSRAPRGPDVRDRRHARAGRRGAPAAADHGRGGVQRDLPHRRRVPRENLLGEIGGGWQVAMTTLLHERGRSALRSRASLESQLQRLRAREGTRGGRPGHPRPRRAGVDRAPGAEADELPLADDADADRRPGPEGSGSKLHWSEQNQRLTKLAMEILGGEDDGYWGYQQLRSRGNTIEAGTSEILRNIIAERVSASEEPLMEFALPKSRSCSGARRATCSRTAAGAAARSPSSAFLDRAVLFEEAGRANRGEEFFDTDAPGRAARRRSRSRRPGSRARARARRSSTHDTRSSSAGRSGSTRRCRIPRRHVRRDGARALARLLGRLVHRRERRAGARRGRGGEELPRLTWPSPRASARSRSRRHRLHVGAPAAHVLQARARGSRRTAATRASSARRSPPVARLMRRRSSLGACLRDAARPVPRASPQRARASSPASAAPGDGTRRAAKEVCHDVTNAAPDQREQPQQLDELRARSSTTPGIALSVLLQFVPLAELRRQLEVNVVGQVAVDAGVPAESNRADARPDRLRRLDRRPGARFPSSGRTPLRSTRSRRSPTHLRLEAASPSAYCGRRSSRPGTIRTEIWKKSAALARSLADAAPPELRELHGARVAAFGRVAR